MNASNSDPARDARWDDLRVFLAVQRAASFSGAARELGVEQSTISRRIAALEEAVGGQLFDRRTRGPALTPLGRALAKEAPAVESATLRCWDALRSQRGALRGRVRLATAESFAVHILLPRFLPTLRERYPELHVDLVLGERAADLGRREADLAIRFFRTAEGDLIEKRIARLETTILGRSQCFDGVTCPSTLPFVTLELAHGESADAAFVRSLGVREPVMRTTSHLAQVEAVRAGLGVALLTCALVDLFPELEAWRHELPPTPPVDVYLVAPRSLRRLPSVDVVWNELTRLGSSLTDPVEAATPA